MQYNRMIKWFYWIGLMFSFIFSVWTLVNFFMLISDSTYAFHQSIFEWWGIYDSYDETYPLWTLIYPVFFLLFSLLLITVGNFLSSKGEGWKKRTLTIVFPFILIFCFYIITTILHGAWNWIDPTEPRVYGQTFGVNWTDYRIVIETVYYSSMGLVTLLPLLLFESIGRNRYYSAIKKFTPIIVLIVSLCMVLTLAYRYSLKPDYYSRFLNDEIQTILILFGIALYFLLIDFYVSKWAELNQTMIREEKKGKKQKIWLILTLLMILSFTAFILSFGSYFARHTYILSFDAHTGEFKGMEISLMILISLLHLSIIFPITRDWIIYYKEIKRQGGKIRYIDSDLLRKSWQPYFLLLFSLLIIIFGVFIWNIGVQDSYDLLSKNVVEYLGFFMVGVGALLAIPTIINVIIFHICQIRLKEYLKGKIYSQDVMIHFSIWYLGRIQRLFTWFNDILFSDRNYKKMWTWGSISVLCGLGFWGVGNALILSDLNRQYFGIEDYYIGILGSLFTSVLFLFPISIGKAFFTKGISIWKIKNLLFSLLLSIFLVNMLMGKGGPYTIQEYDYTYGVYGVLDYDRIWSLLIPAISLVLLSIPVDKKPRWIPSVVISFLIITIPFLIYNWNRVMIDNITKYDNTFETNYLPYFGVILPLILAVIYPYLVEIINWGNSKKSKEDNSKPDRNYKRVLTTLRISFKPVTMGSLPIAIVIFLLPVSTTSLVYDDWHNYELIAEIPEGEDYDFSKEILSRDLESYLGYEPLIFDNIYDPAYVDWETLILMEDHIKDNEKEKEWGNFWLNYEIKVYEEQNLTADFVYMEVQQESYFQDAIMDYKLEVTTSVFFGGVFYGSSFGGWNSLYLDLGERGKTIFHEEGRNYTWELENFTQEIHDIDFISLKLDIGYVTGPLCGYGTYLEQYIGIKDNEIVFIYATRGSWIS